MADNNSPKLYPPYVSYGIFTKSVETLSDTTVPSGPLDRRVLDGLSGADYGALISALRFLGLADEQRKATERYRKLVAAYKQGRAEYIDELREVVFERYRPILGDLD